MDGSTNTNETPRPTSSTEYMEAIAHRALEALDAAIAAPGALDHAGTLRARFTEIMRGVARDLATIRNLDVELAEQLGEAAAKTKFVAALAKVTLATEELRAHQAEQFAGTSSGAAVPESTLPTVIAITPFAVLSPEGAPIRPEHCEQCAAAHAYAQEAADVLSRHVRAGLDELGERARDGATRGMCPDVVALTVASALGRAAGHHIAAQARRNDAHPLLSYRMRSVGLHGLDDASLRVLAVTLAPPTPAPPAPPPARPN